MHRYRMSNRNIEAKHIGFRFICDCAVVAEIVDEEDTTDAKEAVESPHCYAWPDVDVVLPVEDLDVAMLLSGFDHRSVGVVRLTSTCR